MPEVSRPILLDRVGPSGFAVTVHAAPAELPAVSVRLGIPAVRSLRCDFRLQRVGGIIEGHGELRAELTQQCVVTLDEFDSAVHERFTIHFVPAGTEDEDPDPDVPDEVPFEGNTVDLGEAAVEQLALTLDPYPRRPGAALPDDAAEPAAGAFAALDALRTRQ